MEKKDVVLAVVIGLLLGVAWYGWTAGLEALDPSRPLGSELASTWDDYLRETRSKLLVSFGLEHELTGAHKTGFLLAAHFSTNCIPVYALPGSTNGSAWIQAWMFGTNCIPGWAFPTSGIPSSAFSTGSVPLYAVAGGGYPSLTNLLAFSYTTPQPYQETNPVLLTVTVTVSNSNAPAPAAIVVRYRRAEMVSYWNTARLKANDVTLLTAATGQPTTNNAEVEAWCYNTNTLTLWLNTTNKGNYTALTISNLIVRAIY